MLYFVYFVNMLYFKLFNQQKICMLFLKENKINFLQNWLVMLGIPKDSISSNMFIS